MGGKARLDSTEINSMNDFEDASDEGNDVPLDPLLK